MKIKIINGKPKLFTKCSGRIDSFKDLYEAYYWKMRCYRHRRWAKFSRFLIKFLALSLLKRSNIYRKHVKRYKRKPYIEILDKPYKTTCYRLLKGEYNTDTVYYIMEMNVAEYTFWGNSEYEVYQSIIDSMVIKQFQYPYCVKGGVLGAINRIKYRNVQD